MESMQSFDQVELSQFAYYQKDVSQKKTRHQKKHEKIEKLKHDMNDPQMKKQRHKIRRTQDKNKLQRQISGMTEQQARVYLDARKQKKRVAKQKMLQALKNGQQIFIDMVYEKAMSEKENKSLAIQTELIMKCIRHLQAPPGIHLCSVGGLVEQQFKKMCYHYWILESHKQDITEIGKKLNKKLVYLSPDATKPLQEVNDDTAYVIGGLVDRTVIKNASLMRANELGIQARYLPIREFMKNRTCLNLDHVVMIVSKFKQCKSWQQAFEYGAPKRWRKDQNQYGLRKVEEQSDYEDQQNEDEPQNQNQLQKQNKNAQKNSKQHSELKKNIKENKESSQTKAENPVASQ